RVETCIRRAIAFARSSFGIAADQIRLETQIGAGPDALQFFERSGNRDALDVVNPLDPRPETVFIANVATNTAMKIDTPGLDIAVSEFQCLEWNRNFGRPAVGLELCFDVPHTIPTAVDLTALIDHLSVPLGSGRVDRELVAVSSVVECIEDKFEI